VIEELQAASLRVLPEVEIRVPALRVFDVVRAEGGPIVLGHEEILRPELARDWPIGALP
jgi:hypothetical protein